MLNPTSDRLDYGRLLSPPYGYELVAAIGTTYSLDFSALIGVCIALELAEEPDSQLLKNPICLLQALRRAGDKVAVFCQAGQIQAPSDASSLYILLETIVYQVLLEKRKNHPVFHSFHPKFWLARYGNAQGDERWRLVILSRNLTFDRSWDVAVALDGEPGKDITPKNQPIIDFLGYLRSKLPKSASGKRKGALLGSLMSALPRVVFSAQSIDKFQDFEFIPVGVPNSNGGIYTMNETKLFSHSFQNLLIMSPFLSKELIKEFNTKPMQSNALKRVLVTRKEALSEFQANDCDKFAIYTMKNDIVNGEASLSEEPMETRQQDIHAKLYLWHEHSNSELYLGSMNASNSGRNGNVECMICLKSRSRWLNLEMLTTALFGADPDGPQNPFELTPLPPAQKQDANKTAALEKMIKALCHATPQASVREEDGTYTITLSFKDLESGEGLTVSPLLTKQTLAVSEQCQFSGLALLQLSEFYRVTAANEEVRISRTIKIPTLGIPKERDMAVFTSIVKNTGCFYQYISFLLSDDYLSTAVENENLKHPGKNSHGNSLPPGLYEEILQTAARTPDKLKEIGNVLTMIKSKDVIPSGFAELYDSLKRAVKIND
ncbi:hypothetical protein DDIC_07840 [Desulfovibrio desulfuricans]|uniref:PLD phosphodiesterase domain-containing protein n=1 Tax=Desulfovibrio desulfuricans TaxID=876 RepID=A0A4P7UHL9_DESDE|nr:phospholipase D family protein [Desulfovibrio desulfuricans]QCC85786.1 hypothetical protein DDIC_07840 [Desulfovibrio desulfuricans]